MGEGGIIVLVIIAIASVTFLAMLIWLVRASSRR